MYWRRYLGAGACLTAAYAMVLFPIVALLLSTFFEDFHWKLRDLAGVVLILAGNGLVLAKPSRSRREMRTQAPGEVAAATRD